MARSTEHDYDIKALRRQLDLDRKAGWRSPYTRGRAQSADARQLPISKYNQLRDPATGKMYFVVGYSQVGGPDIVHP